MYICVLYPMTKRLYILFVFILGFAVAPSVAVACGSGSEKCCCTSKTAQKADAKDCCKKNANQPKEKDDCGGKCSDKSCHCPTVSYSLMSAFYFEMSHFSFHFSGEKHNFCRLEIYPSAGFYSIWTPPNIG